MMQLNKTIIAVGFWSLVVIFCHCPRDYLIIRVDVAVILPFPCISLVYWATVTPEFPLWGSIKDYFILFCVDEIWQHCKKLALKNKKKSTEMREMQFEISKIICQQNNKISLAKI